MNKRIAVLILPISILVATLVMTPVQARDGGSGSNDSNETTTTTSGSSEPADSSSTAKTENEQKQEVETEAKAGIKRDQENTAETETEDILSEFKKNNKEHSADERKTICKAEEKGLETKLANLSKNATAFHTRIDDILAKALAYQKDNNVTVTNFDQLVATAKAAQTQSASSVSVLNGLNVNLDCSLTTVAQNVAKFKVAAKQARTDLSAYKEAVKAILTALEAAKEGN